MTDREKQTIIRKARQRGKRIVVHHGEEAIALDANFGATPEQYANILKWDDDLKKAIEFAVIKPL